MFSIEIFCKVCGKYRGRTGHPKCSKILKERYEAEVAQGKHNETSRIKRGVSCAKQYLKGSYLVEPEKHLTVPEKLDETLKKP